MRAVETDIPEVKIVEPQVFGDDRGFFMEAWQRRKFAALGIEAEFVQDNHSRSTRGVLRGLHYQIRQPQGKLVRCIAGRVFDVAVDLRRTSPSFRHWVGVELSADNKRMLWIPEGFAHGFLVLSETADILYKASDYYAPAHDRSLRWDDPELGIEWPLAAGEKPVLSDKDAAAPSLAEAELYE